MMTTKELKMAQEVEKARELSFKVSPVWAMTNGERVVKCIEDTGVEWAKEHGYWTVAIFEHGFRVEA